MKTNSNIINATLVCTTCKPKIGDKLSCTVHGDEILFYSGNIYVSKLQKQSERIRLFNPEKNGCEVVATASSSVKIKFNTVEFCYNNAKYTLLDFANKMTNGNLEIATKLIEDLRKSGQVSEVGEKKLEFANQQYTLKEFANKMTNGDIKSAEIVLENLIKSGSVKWIESEASFNKIQATISNGTNMSINKLNTRNMSSSVADKTFFNLVAHIDNRKLAHDINELMLHKPIRRKDNKAISVLALSTLLAEHALKSGDKEEYLIYRDILLKWNEDETWWPTIIEVIFCVGKDTGVTDKFFDDILEYLEANADEILMCLDKIK